MGPVDQVNGLTFVVTEKPVGQGAETVTISSPKSKNVYTVDRLNELMESLKDGHEDETVTSIFITATVADSSNPFEASERIETKDTKVVSKGLAYDETLALSEDPNIRQVSLQSLAETYHKVVSYTLNEKAKPAVTFTNGQVTLSSIYLALSLGFLRVITENALIEFKLELSHSPIPPLLLLAMCRARKGTEKSKLPDGFELYMALACPEYSKVRAPEILAMGLADVFIPEGKLSDAFDTAKKMAVCPAPDTTSAVQLALAIYHSYAGPNRLQVWEKEIESVFGVIHTHILKEINN